jgi:hypothetical protein
MRDLGQILERESDSVDLGTDAFERLLQRRDTRERRQRISAAVLIVLLIGGLAAAALSAVRNQQSKPASTDLTSDTVSSLQTLWTYDTGGIAAPPAAGDGVVVTLDGAGQLAAFEPQCRSDGGPCTPLWTAAVGHIPTYPDAGGTLSGPFFVGGPSGSNAPGRVSPIVITGGVVSTVGANGVVYAFSTTCRSDGGRCEPLWTGSPLGKAVGYFEVADGTAYVSDGAGSSHGLYAFRGCATDGSVCRPSWYAPDVWSYRVQDGAIYVIKDGRGVAAQLDPTTGKEIWSGGPGPGTCCDVDVAPVRSGDAVYAAFGNSATNRAVWAFPADCTGTCEPTWIGEVPDAYANGPVVTGGGVTMSVATDGTTGGLVTFPVDCATGGAVCPTMHRSRVDAELTTVSPVVSNGKVVAVSMRTGGVWAFDPACLVAQDGCAPLWHAFVSSPEQPVTVGDLVFVGDIRTGPIQAFPIECTPKPVVGAPQPIELCPALWKSDYNSVDAPAVLDGVVYGTDSRGVVHASGFPGGVASQIGKTPTSRPETSPIALFVVALALLGLTALGAYRRRLGGPALR